MCKISLEEKQEWKNTIIHEEETLYDSNLLQEAACDEFPFF